METISLPQAVWEERRAQHIARVATWADSRVDRASKAVADPVYDFLFTYYPFRPSHLKRWTPGMNVILEGADPADLDWPEDFIRTNGGAVIPENSFPTRRRPYLEWAHKYLSGIAERPPQFSCFGLHEWAMVYRCDAPRHNKVPLRLTPREIDTIVENSALRCTHYDAFRFFTPDAAPLNKTPLSREATSTFDQRACIHVTMDLYKFAQKIAPWCSSDLIGDSFLLAADARRIDMRASPYDLRDRGFEPILIETSAGQEEYIHEQRRMAELAVPIRACLIDVYGRLLEHTPLGEAAPLPA
jgi:hypothetical protein